jgi:hypothetical protein
MGNPERPLWALPMAKSERVARVVVVLCVVWFSLCFCCSALRNDSEASAERVRLGFGFLRLLCIELCSSNVYMFICC